MSKYTWTNDWAKANESVWPEVLAHFIGKPNVHFAEIGSYEGRSACWFVDNILTGEGCAMSCFDTWVPYADHPNVHFNEVEQRFDANTAACSRPEIIRKVKAGSASLGGFPGYDMIYVDGSHSALDVLTDAVRAWQALKVGGLLLFDDYSWHPIDRNYDDCPKPSINAFTWTVAVGGHGRIAYANKILIVVEKLK